MSRQRRKRRTSLCLYPTTNSLSVPKRYLLVLLLRRRRRNARLLSPRPTLPLSQWSRSHHSHHPHRVLLLLLLPPPAPPAPAPQDHGPSTTCALRHRQSPATAKPASQPATAVMATAKRTFSNSPVPVPPQHRSTVMKWRIPSMVVLVRQRLQRPSRAGASSLPNLVPPL